MSKETFMSKTTSLSGAALATAAAALFVSTSFAVAPSAQAEEAIVKCHGVNACRERGNCGSADHKCAGLNGCKGKSFVPVTKKVCDQLGGVTRDDE
jgi:uncharacterized membrane protein